MQTISQTPYDLNNEPFDEQTNLEHSNTEIVRYSDPHCIHILDQTVLIRY